MDTFTHHGEITLVDGRSLTRTQLKGADVLLVRSVTRVGPDLLSGTPVKFVGSATIGTDHLDTGWLETERINWASAPGCNAVAAAQYTLAMILLACSRLGTDLRSCRVGIVGMGNVGSRLHRLLSVLGVEQQKFCDPPLAESEKVPPGLTFQPLAALLGCEMISLHVPLTPRGAHPTAGLIGRDFLSKLQPGALLVNSSRGKVVDETALLHWLRSGNGRAALDVFPREPEIEPELLSLCTVATPHVAGYSSDGRSNGTAIIYRKFRHWLGLHEDDSPLATVLPEESLMLSGDESPEEIVLRTCPVERDDSNLRGILSAGERERAAQFDLLRSEYPPRRDFGGWTLRGNCPESLRKTVSLLGFH